MLLPLLLLLLRNLALYPQFLLVSPAAIVESHLVIVDLVVTEEAEAEAEAAPTIALHIAAIVHIVVEIAVVLDILDINLTCLF